MIIIDYSGISIGPVAMGQARFNDENLIRHMILNSIRMYRTKFKKYGELVIVADAGGNWRKEIYPEYKASRAKNREESKIDWNEAFRIINMVLAEIKEHMPYKVIHQWGCEADDSIAELVRWTQEFGNYEEVMIVSADKDFKQLQKYGNVKQYSPMLKKEVKEDDPHRYLLEHILNGDPGDGVPNVLSDDKVMAEGRRQNVLSSKKKAALFEDPKALGEEVYRNFFRNKKMIDLTEDTACPIDVREKIINNFTTQDPSVKKSKVMPYLVSKNCRLLLENVKEFIH